MSAPAEPSVQRILPLLERPPPYPVTQYYFNSCSIESFLIADRSDGAEYYFNSCSIGKVSQNDPEETTISSRSRQCIRFTTPAINKQPSSSYDYYPKHRLVADGPLPSWLELPRPDEDDNEEYVEFYLVDQQMYKIHHKQRSLEFVPPHNDSDDDSDDITSTPALGTYRDYWGYVEKHPALHSVDIRYLILDLRFEAVQLMQRFPGSIPFDTTQVMQRLTKIGRNRDNGDAKVVGMIAMVFSSLGADSGASKMASKIASKIASDDKHWMSIQHPDGWLYFFHPIHHIVVDARQESFNVPFSVDEIDEIYKSESEFLKVSHTQRWLLRNGNPTPLNNNATHRDYWAYIAKYPSHHPIYTRKDLLGAREEALRYLRWCSLEALVPSPSPTAPFHLKLSQDLHELVSKIEEMPSLDASQDAPSIMMIAKVLAKKYEIQTSYEFGQVIRVEFEKSGQPASPMDRPRNFLFILAMTTICFGAPFRYLRYISELDTMFLRGENWGLHIKRLVKEWTDSNLLATVILAAAVAFLAIPDLKVVSRTSILISILSALGSLVAGIFCVSKYQSHTPEVDAIRSSTLKDAENYKHNLLAHQYHRRMYYAIILSLPIVLLIWSMISFTVAIIAFNFGGTMSSPILPGPSQGVVSVWAFILFLSGTAVLGVEFIWHSSRGSLTLRRLIRRFMRTSV